MSKKIKEIVNQHFFRPAWYSVIINPYFIARYGLLLKIKNFAKNDFSGKKILDVGCGIKPYKNLFNSSSYVGIDIDYGGHNNQAKVVDKFYDGVNIPYDDNSFDIVICTEVMEHVVDPEKLLSEIHRVLKIGGRIFFLCLLFGMNMKFLMTLVVSRGISIKIFLRSPDLLLKRLKRRQAYLEFAVS